MKKKHAILAGDRTALTRTGRIKLGTAGFIILVLTVLVNSCVSFNVPSEGVSGFMVPVTLYLPAAIAAVLVCWALTPSSSIRTHPQLQSRHHANERERNGEMSAA
jgi:hypothetical protein